MKHLLIFIITFLFLQGCSKEKSDQPPVITGIQILELVKKAVLGDKSANDSINELIDLSFPVNTNYNKLVIDSLISEQKFFTVLLEYPNPVYSRFAVYDDKLRCCLIDRSLNGFINMENLRIEKYDFIKVEEAFRSKGRFDLNRLSLYKADSSVNLSYRTFTFFKMPRRSFEQRILEITEEKIETAINSSGFPVIKNTKDVFAYNSSSKKYISSQNTFDNFVLSEITKYESPGDRPEITSRRTALESAGMNPDPDTIISSGSMRQGNFNLMLNEEWKEIKNSDFPIKLKKRIPADEFFNETTGARFIIIKLPQKDSAETYINYNLDSVLTGNYKVRYSNKIKEKDIYLSVFEFSCDTNKYLMILAAPVNSYGMYREEYSNIINTFYMEC